MKIQADKNDIKIYKSKEFAVYIIKLCKQITEDYKEYNLTNQLIRSGTSIGANLNEANRAQSDADFLSKCSIALKEIQESQYWLELLYEVDYIDKERFDFMYNKALELNKIVSEIILTKKEHTYKV